MAKTVSNDALCEKLSVISEQLNSLLLYQKSQISSSEQAKNIFDFNSLKDEIITEVKEEIRFLGMHGDINFGTVNQNIATLDEIIRKVWNIATGIRRQQKGDIELQAKNKGSYLNFKFFRFRKSSLASARLGLLVLLLTGVCMKQQNDYTLLNDEYYRQSVGIRDLQAEADSLRNTLTYYNMRKK